MCIVIAKEAGVPFSQDELESAVNCAVKRNSHGSGYALKRAGSSEIKVAKGFLYSEVLLEHIADLDVQDGDELMVHLRYATAGKKGTLGCHPYVVSEDDEVIQQDDAIITDNPVFSHNGTFYDFIERTSDFSDTYNLGKEFLAKEGVIESLILIRDTSPDVFKSIITFNKLAIMFPDADKPMELFGEFITTSGYFNYSNYYFENQYNGKIPKHRGNTHSNRHSHSNPADDYYGDYPSPRQSNGYWNSIEQEWEEFDEDNEAHQVDFNCMHGHMSVPFNKATSVMQHLNEVYEGKKPAVIGFKQAEKQMTSNYD